MTTAEDVEERVSSPAPRSARRRIALVVLSGDRAEARRRLAEIAPDAAAEDVEKSSLEPRRAAKTVAAMRAARYDEVAFFSLSTRWQRRRAPLLLLGIAGGARRVLLYNAEG